jgi:hypothetical protein
MVIKGHKLTGVTPVSKNRTTVTGIPLVAKPRTMHTGFAPATYHEPNQLGFSEGQWLGGLKLHIVASCLISSIAHSNAFTAGVGHEEAQQLGLLNP